MLTLIFLSEIEACCTAYIDLKIAILPSQVLNVLCFELLYGEATSAQVGAHILRHIPSTVSSLQAVLSHTLVGRLPHTQVQGAPHFRFATQTVPGQSVRWLNLAESLIYS